MGSESMCRASFNYLSRRLKLPKSREMAVYDGRAFANPGWQISGFELIDHHSQVGDWGDKREVARVHYPEISALAKQLTGCDFALVEDHIARNPEQARVHDDLAPIRFVHSDFAPSYGKLIRDFYASGADDAKRQLHSDGVTAAQVQGARRLLIIQFWRNVGPAKMDLPLAFCDARSVPATDVLAVPVKNYAGSGFDFEVLAITAPKGDQHRWYSFPEMTIDELAVFRTYDTELIDSGSPFWTPHSAFRDPDVEEGKPSRYSIELRATCLFM